MEVTHKFRKIRTYVGHFHVRFNDWIENPEPLWIYKKKESKAEIWNRNANIIRHAGGELYGQLYTNSVEAVKKSLENNDTLIELDFGLTKDEKLVISHETLRNQKISYEQYLQEVDDNFSKMNLDMLTALLVESQQVFIIVDAKGNNRLKVIKEIVEECVENKEILNRFIIQIYNFGDLEAVKRIYKFPHYIFTLYASGLSIYNSRKIIKFCLRNQIKNITMPKHWVESKRSLRLYHKYDLKVWLHTINEKEELKKYQKWGIYGIYSDYLGMGKIGYSG